MIFLLLIMFFTLFLVLTRKSTVKLIKEDILRVEIHMQILAVLINPTRRQNGRQKSRKQKAVSRRTILSAVRGLIKHSRVIIHKLYIPFPQIALNPLMGEIGQRIFLSSVISYIETISDDVYISNNAIILSPDVDSIRYNIIIECRLYHIIYRVIRLTLHKMKEKIHVRE